MKEEKGIHDLSFKSCQGRDCHVGEHAVSGERSCFFSF